VDHVGRYVYGWHRDFFLPKEFSAVIRTKPQTRLLSGDVCLDTRMSPHLLRAHPIADDSFEFDYRVIETGQTYGLGDSLAMVNPVGRTTTRQRPARPRTRSWIRRLTPVTFTRVEYRLA